MSVYDFDRAFLNPPPINVNGRFVRTEFDNKHFVNDKTLLNNNLKDILLHEEIKEYSVMIDSKDRNYQVYLNPFRYDVRFAPKPIYDPNNSAPVDPNPVITDNFTNVRYIKLETIILPFYTNIDYKELENLEGEKEYITVIDTKKKLTDDMYVTMSIGDYTDANSRSTNDVLSNSFATIYYDYKVNRTHYLGRTENGIKIFKQDQLAKIDKLKISFTDPYGKLLTCDHLDKNIKSNFECLCSEYDDIDDCCFLHNLNHPLNPHFQHHIHLKVGVLEPRLGKKTFN